MLEFLLSSCKSAYIIIDGLDECEREERKVITQWFRHLVESLPENAPDHLRCLFVSQDDRIGTKDLQGLANINIKPQNNKPDVLAYSKVQAEELRRKFEFSEEESSRIAVAVVESVKGIFLLAKLIWINLIAQITLAEVEEQMKEFPPEINKAFLIDNSRYIDIVAKELELACLCIDYLDLPAFADQPTAERILNGDYGFLDYAVLNWTRHLEAGILELDGHDDEIGELSESLETFIRMHWIKPTVRLPISGGTQKRLKCFESLDFYDQLEQSVVSWKKQLRRFEGVKPGEVALDLSSLVLSVRKVLEHIVTSSSDSSTQKKVKDKYGNMVFKCPRLTCQFFIIGFFTQNERDEHLDKHTRPFRCTDEGCRGSIFGFASIRERDKHIRDIHPEEASHDREFPTDEEVARSMRNDTVTEETTAALEQAPPPLPEQEPLSESESESVLEPEREEQGQSRSRERGKPRQFKCPHCPNVYRKKFNLTSHLKSHTNERPFECDQCTKAFARPSDLVRHEETHQEKQYLCRGVLSNGATWGCGKAFARADTLKAHHKSEAGRRCILPFEQEQEQRWNIGELA
ncbi:hypothetical protein H9Q72_010384 [Fusarium xylarioides]|uniref:C2H2-type domain-containing protein n=1 Tax=Fusarium xylarioides TaxID=221167 RepID=A0A9P7KY04_9HYPO|nr:hypothetical protein H9Q70_004427 [Fusarium xylarioides]KAG5761493.1 hypothetical protein H9Q72_010384 [Fusarium xylarioides]